MDEVAIGTTPLGSKLLLVLLDNKEKRYPLAKRIGAELKGGRRKVMEELRAMEAHGLVRFAPDAGEQPDFSKARAVEITEKGEEFVLRELKVNPGCLVKGAAFFGALEALRRRVGDLEAKLAAARGGPATAAPPPAPAQAPPIPATAPSPALRDGITRAFLDRERAQRGYVAIFEIRRALPHAGRAEFDEALLQLQQDGLLYLTKLNDPRDIPEDQIRDGILSPVRGRLFYVSRGEKL